MRTAEPFLAAVAARPGDDLPRLIFADWLDEHGYADRAEFIRLQCAAARGGAPPDARRRIADLEATHRRDWLADLPGSVYHAEFRRGFPEHLVLPARTFLADGERIRRRTPVRSVALLGAGPILRELLDGPLLAGLTGLHLTDAQIADVGVARVA